MPLSKYHLKSFQVDSSDTEYGKVQDVSKVRDCGIIGILCVCQPISQNANMGVNNRNTRLLGSGANKLYFQVPRLCTKSNVWI
jgi:hypothetical protein